MEQLYTSCLINNVKKQNKLARFDYLKKPINIASLGVASTINAMSLLCENQMLGLSLFLSAASLASLIAQYFTYYESYEEKCFDDFVKKLQKMPEYKEAIHIYKSFIKDLVLYFDYLKLKNPLDICFYCKLMLDNGYFSYQHNHEYKDYNFSAPCDYNLLGGRIFTGTSVCRHMATFFNDTLRETGATVMPLMVKCYNEREAQKASKYEKPDHLIVGIKDVYGKYAYDPTNGIVATTDNVTNIKSSKGDIIKSVLSKNYYLVTDKQYEERLGQQDDISDEYNRTNYVEFNRKALINRKRMIEKLFNDCKDKNDYFYNYEYDKISAIANYQELICPENNSQEFKW